jgi:hypothetical protein
MKRYAFAFLLFALFRCGAGADPEPGAAAAESGGLWFPVGEELNYRIYWGFIPVGRSRIVTRWVERDGRRLLSIVYRTKTNRFFDRIYPFDDLSETLVDPVRYRPVRFRTRLVKRDLASDSLMEFDYDAGKARWTSLTEHREYDIPLDDGLLDIASFLYFLRRTGLQPGETKTLRFIGDSGVVEGVLRAYDYEKVDLPAYGAVRGLKVKPEADFGGFLVQEGKVTAWVSDDPRRLCLRLVVNGLLANAKVVLCHVGGPGDDFWIRNIDPDALPPCDAERDIEEAMRSLDTDGGED